MSTKVVVCQLHWPPLPLTFSTYSTYSDAASYLTWNEIFTPKLIKIFQWRTFQKFDQLCEKVSESGNQERCCQTDRQTSTRRSIIWGEPLHFAGLRESMKSYFWNRFYSKSKWKDTSCIIYYLHYYLLNVSYHNVTNLVPKEGGVMRAFSGYGQARRDI